MCGHGLLRGDDLTGGYAGFPACDASGGRAIHHRRQDACVPSVEGSAFLPNTIRLSARKFKGMGIPNDVIAKATGLTEAETEQL